MRILITVILAPAVFFISTIGGMQYHTSENSYHILRSAPFVMDYSVGFTGTTPQEFYAFWDILDDVDAEAVFTKILEDATPAGKYYALSGLYLVSPSRFDDAIENFEGDIEGVMMMSGCLLFSVSKEEILDGSLPRDLALSFSRGWRTMPVNFFSLQ